MTMVPSQNRKQNNSNNNNSKRTSRAMNQVEVVEGSFNNCLLGSDFLVRRRHNNNTMAAETEEESSSRPTNNNNNNTEAEPEPGGSTSKEEEGEEAEEEATNANANNNNNNTNNWLQLSIGFHHQTSSTTKHALDRTGSATGSGLVELDLLPSQSHRSLEQQPSQPVFPVAGSGRGSFGGSLLFDQTTSPSMSIPSGPSIATTNTNMNNINSTSFGHQEMMNMNMNVNMNWAFGPLLPHSMPIINVIPNSSSSSSLRPSPNLLGPFNFPSPFHHPHHFPSPSSSSSSSAFDHRYCDVAAPGPSSDLNLRVVHPPPRPHSGIWFMLQASPNQVREPFLPQIPKNYLRIKDGRMTVRLLLKYLVSKLRLESESEIEITCRGQQLLPFLTLQHVRDNIWTPRDTTRALLSDSSTTDHVMVLHYGRTTAPNN